MPSGQVSMLVLADDAAEAVTSADVQPGEVVRVGDRFGQWHERSGVGDALVQTILLGSA